MESGRKQVVVPYLFSPSIAGPYRPRSTRMHYGGSGHFQFFLYYRKGKPAVHVITFDSSYKILFESRLFLPSLEAPLYGISEESQTEISSRHLDDHQM